MLINHSNKCNIDNICVINNNKCNSTKIKYLSTYCNIQPNIYYNNKFEITNGINRKLYINNIILMIIYKNKIFELIHINEPNEIHNNYLLNINNINKQKIMQHNIKIYNKLIIHKNENEPEPYIHNLNLNNNIY